jgi:hypothetical protein
LSDDNSEREPPESIPNSEVKPFCADGSVGSPHVRVGHRQAFYSKNPDSLSQGFLLSFIIVHIKTSWSDRGGQEAKKEND